MNSTMFRILSTVSLATVMTFTALGQMPSSAQKTADNLSRAQLQTLVASAATPAQHQRIAAYYRAKAQDYLAQAQMHQAMIVAYKADTTRVNNKNQASTIGHCEYFVQSLTQLAAKSQEMAELHEQMAAGAAARR